jgi:light-independent protochlorophyllide reductase subunit B
LRNGCCWRNSYAPSTRPTYSAESDLGWTPDGQAELNKIPGFVRGKVKRNTEKFARDRGFAEINAEVLYAAKEAVGA